MKMLKPNRNKTELLVIGPQQKVNPPIKGIYVAGDYLEARSARNIGVIFDSHVNLNLRETCYEHLQNGLLSPTKYSKDQKLSLSQEDAETLVHAFISSKLGFCSALLYGLPKSVIDRLQYVQNCAARLVTRTRSSEHITPVLRRLHWLPVTQRITYKILLLTYKALNGMAPRYITDLFQPYTPTRQLRSFSKNWLETPKSNLETRKFYGDRSFQVAAPRLWNSLTDDITSIHKLDIFKNKIKTLPFIDAFTS